MCILHRAASHHEHKSAWRPPGCIFRLRYWHPINNVVIPVVTIEWWLPKTTTCQSWRETAALETSQGKKRGTVSTASQASEEVPATQTRGNGPVYLAAIELPKSKVWYKRERMGIHSINSFMKSLVAQPEIENKRLTNHSARKTLVKKLKAANQLRSAIIGVTGHTNERSLADYEEGDDNEQRLISSIMSTAGQASTSNQCRPLQNVGIFSAVENTLMMNEGQLMTISNFHGCQVTINYQFSQMFSEPRCNVP